MGNVFELNFISFFANQNGGDENSSKSRKGSLVCDSNSLLMELFMNYSESNNMASVGNTPNGSMKVT
jgi:hypothetical protein